MKRLLKLNLFYYMFLLTVSSPLIANANTCRELLKTNERLVSTQSWNQRVINLVPAVIERTKAFTIDKTLDVIGYMKGLPKYLKRMRHLITSEGYLNYTDFGHMGLAEIGISLRVNQEKLLGLNTERPLIIVANHPLGIADGLSLQYLSRKVRPTSPALLMLARWIEKLMPNAVYGDEKKWGTAVPVEINMPAESDPDYERKTSEINDFNSQWSKITFQALRQQKASVIIFPAGQVARMSSENGSYPNNVHDEQGSWQDGLIRLAKLGRADIVFAHIDSVNSKAFYKHRKKLSDLHPNATDKERVIWFFSEALAKKNKTIDIYLSDPQSLSDIYHTLSLAFDVSEEELKADDSLTTELMRRLTHDLNSYFPQELDHTESPRRL